MKTYTVETSTGTDAGTSRANWRPTDYGNTIEQAREAIANAAGEIAATADNGTAEDWWALVREAKRANPGDVVGGGAYGHLERAWRFVEEE